MSTTVSTESLSPGERAEFWHEAVSQAFIPLEVRLLEREPSSGILSSDQLGVVQISGVAAGPQVVTRSRRTIEAGGEGWVALTMQHQGHARISQDGREIICGPGELALCDSSRPFTKEFPTAFGFTAFRLPRHVLHVRDQELRAATASPFESTSGCVELVTTYLRTLASGAAKLDPCTGSRLADTAVDLLALLIQERSGTLDPTAPETAPAMLARIKDYAMCHLGDPSLSPERIATAHHVSVRYLHKLFQGEETTMAHWIQRRRLEMCAHDLSRRAFAAPTVSSVARRWGFVSPTHFSRVFRAAYGVTPREWRARAGGADHPLSPAR
ncbi:AraC-like DNA-binding protein [Kitasatospora sp. MAA19]|uniref:AraC-like ligand-binding domain-containing protein n=1 Tax=Kitasatospora sp. MAA19 TaxID=3035090 RepID=UPI002474A5CB|nr:helix-turn-helix domain-containing protein [Kitasatospora sp. MAA19]MDH6708379.1 AraC-like DNA-binding protein [Kitasatospora sp. MAA19]